LNQVARVVCAELCVPARDFGGIRSRETYLDAKIAAVEQKLERTRNQPKLRRRYEATLATLRKMKAERQAQRRHATVYSSKDICSAMNAAA
jgi:hypothetical protein